MNIREMLEKGSGLTRYPWQNAEEGETAPLCPVCCERDDAVSYLSQLEHVKQGSCRTCATCQAVFWELLKSELPVVPGDAVQRGGKHGAK